MRNKTPKITSHFYDIESQITNLINNAKSSIYVATGWFTNSDLFERLIASCRRKLHVEILVSNNYEAINEDIEEGIDELTQNGGNIFSVSIDTSYSSHAMMHNKFCIIDEEIVITGSYNWTNNANHSKENIVIIRDEQIANQYLTNFISLRALGKNLSTPYNDIEMYFTSTKKYVGLGMPFHLHWDVRNASNTTLNGEYVNHKDNKEYIITNFNNLKDYEYSENDEAEDSGVVKEKIYQLVAENEYTSVQKSITIKVLQKPTIQYKITVKVNGVIEERAKLKIEDSYIAPIGSEITLEWDIKYAENSYLDNSYIRNKGSKILLVSGTKVFTLKADNKLYESSKDITIHMIEIPRLEKVALPFPYIETNLKVDLNRSSIPANFSLTGIKNKVQLPEIQSLSLAIKDTQKSLNNLKESIFSKMEEIKTQK